MRISSKGRYALASLVYLANKYESGEYIAIFNISESLGISKIYLEQIFSALKKSGIVNSIKGPQGGYQLSKSPKELSVLDVLLVTEAVLFEKAEPTVENKSPNLEAALHSIVFNPLDECINKKLKDISIKDLLEESTRNKGDNYIFYI
ncbi:Rrf2 family transcriptional regulator [Tissierella sp. Yu-01]|uniref:RrF2 family transcriptional regulator n=1 Tax=Tissierella sp. Yu-01 TaxID=3035694 RepID=UPI00240D319A|nr:Rrf2 family transcriptional regulator [Tissierella sp. Yu-01]WFA09166.1 Rrf2 family transcriptional regulator [Tissierella sp. Yu-01]